MNKMICFGLSVASLIILNALNISPVHAQSKAAAQALLTKRVPTGAELAKTAYVLDESARSSSAELSHVETKILQLAFKSSYGISTLKNGVHAEFFNFVSQSNAEGLFKINTSSPTCAATYARAYEDDRGDWKVGVFDFNLGNVNTQLIQKNGLKIKRRECPLEAYGHKCYYLGNPPQKYCRHSKDQPIMKPELCKNVEVTSPSFTYLVRVYSGPANPPHVSFYVETPVGTNAQRSHQLYHEVIFRFRGKPDAEAFEAQLLKIKREKCQKRDSGGKA